MEQKYIFKFTITNDGTIKMNFKQLLSTKLLGSLKESAPARASDIVTINKPGNSFHGKKGRVFYRHPDGRVNVQVGDGKNIKANLTLKKDEFNESFDLKAELDAAEEYANKKLKDKRKLPVDTDDSWSSSKHTQVTDKSFADTKPVGRRHIGTYGTSYNPSDDEENPVKATKDTSGAPKKRGRPVGALGIAKTGLNKSSAGDSSKNLAQLLGIKLDRKLMGKKPTIRHKLSDVDTSGIKVENTDLYEMSYMPSNRALSLVDKYSLGLDPSNPEHQKTIAGRIRKALNLSRVVVMGHDKIAHE